MLAASFITAHSVMIEPNMLPLCVMAKGEHIFLKGSTDMEEMDINY